ncbi:LOW QUALITY PROTEIN: F-box/WD repeat-containing protein 12 [Ciconia maguari]
MAYLSDNEQLGAGKLRSLACTASPDGTVTAWNGQEGATAGGATYTLTIPDVNQVSCKKLNRSQVSYYQDHFRARLPCMEGHRTEIILLGCGSALKLQSIFGALLERFQDHHDTITSIWVDSCRVVTSSLDPSLIHTWKKANKSCALLSRYH